MASCGRACPGVGMLAVATDARILPVDVDQSHRPREWTLRRVRLRVTFGTPRTWQELAGPGLPGEPSPRCIRRSATVSMREIAALKAS
jgi:hypothetical protein